MQSVKSALRNPTTWGAGALVFVAVVSLVAAFFYISPPWQRLVTFYTDDAASLSVGDQVRMAGITVGAVKDLSFEQNQVRVRARVDEDAFVGDQSQIAVRMLTVVGGYYVNIDSMGSAPLGDKPIPRERVTMPYSLIRTLNDTTKITDNVAPKPINESLNQIQQGLSGKNIDSLAAIIDAGNSIMSTIDRQQGQITKILNVSDEFIRAVKDYRAPLVQLIRKVSIVIATIELYSKGFASAIDGLGEAVLALRPIGYFYLNHREEFIEKVRDYQAKVRNFVERNGLTVRVLHRMQNLFDRVLDAQNASPGLLATDLCIPVPGSPC
jgi:phospholipid/cholesterol/gamma-HCH transport system substrate-binding protein